MIEQAQNVTAIIADNPLAVTHSQLDKRSDEIFKFIRAREDFIQNQIDELAEASILNSLDHVGRKHWLG